MHTKSECNLWWEKEKQESERIPEVAQLISYKKWDSGCVLSLSIAVIFTGDSTLESLEQA